MVLEPIRFRYSTESIVDEPEAPAESAPEAEERPQKPRRNDRRRSRGPKPETRQQAQNPAPQQEQKPERPRKPRPPREEQGTPAEQKPSAAVQKIAGESLKEGPSPSGEQKNRRRGNYRNYRRNRGPARNSGENS